MAAKGYKIKVKQGTDPKKTPQQKVDSLMNTPSMKKNLADAAKARDEAFAIIDKAKARGEAEKKRRAQPKFQKSGEERAADRAAARKAATPKVKADPNKQIDEFLGTRGKVNKDGSVTLGTGDKGYEAKIKNGKVTTNTYSKRKRHQQENASRQKKTPNQY